MLCKYYKRIRDFFHFGYIAASYCSFEEKIMSGDLRFTWSEPVKLVLPVYSKYHGY